MCSYILEENDDGGRIKMYDDKNKINEQNKREINDGWSGELGVVLNCIQFTNDRSRWTLLKH